MITGEIPNKIVSKKVRKNGRFNPDTKDWKAAAEAKPPDPPPHLSKKMKAFWIGVFELKNLQPYQILILLKACEAYDRAEQARRIPQKAGLDV